MWVPSSGVRLVEPLADIPPIKAADFNMEALKLDMVFNHLETKLYPMLNIEEMRCVKGNWDLMREKLDRLDRNKHNIPPMKFSDLPKQPHRDGPAFTVPENFQFLVNDEVIEPLDGCLAPDTADSHGSELYKGQVIAVWTQAEDR